MKRCDTQEFTIIRPDGVKEFISRGDAFSLLLARKTDAAARQKIPPYFMRIINRIRAPIRARGRIHTLEDCAFFTGGGEGSIPV